MTTVGPARFDDLVAGRAWEFPAPESVLVARRPGDVVGVLDAVDAATRAGAWAFGVVGFEAAGALDPALEVGPVDPAGPPLVWFGLGGPPRPAPVVGPPEPGRYRTSRWRPDWTEAGHAEAVVRAQGHIAAGDVFQVNLTSRLHADFTGDPAALYADLALNQRPRHAARLDLGDHVVLSASPELFLRWTRDELLTRPMKGTAVRGRHPVEDRRRREALVTSTKERAENIIVVDLLRNDVSRVARTGTVRTPQLCRAERYENVWQLTSDVTGEVPADTPLVEVFRALFPSGSVTGAPKPRAMQVIHALEQQPRGVYCGAVGWVAPPTAPVRASFAVAIRTAVLDRSSGVLTYGTGSGITWASDPAAEVAELAAKAAILGRPAPRFRLLETLAATADEGVRHLERHLDRLAASARHLGFPLEREHARDALLAAAEQGPARLRLTLDRTGAVEVIRATLPSPADGPVRLVVDDVPSDARATAAGELGLFHKTTARELYEQAAARHPDADDVVLVNALGEVTETTVANLAVRLDGVWWTPPLDAGLLPGVERGRLLEQGVLRERRLSVDQLVAADELALVSSLRGWRTAVLQRTPGAELTRAQRSPG